MKKQRPQGQPQPDLFADAAQRSSAPPVRASPPSGLRPAARTPSPRIVAPPAALLNVREAAARLGLAKSTLDKMRCAGKGPRYVKSTDRAVRYDPVDLDAWIAARRRNGAPDQN